MNDSPDGLDRPERVPRSTINRKSPPERPAEVSGEKFAESDLGRQVGAFFGHLEELRNRLVRAIIAVLAGMAVCLIFSERIVQFIIKTAGKPEDIKLALLTPTEGVMVYLKVGLVAGIFLSSPFWFAQLWGFVSPGLYSREKRIAAPIIAASAGAFLAGAAFGYILLPYTAAYFLSFAGGQVEAIWSLSSYVNMALQFTLVFGVIFELPLLIYAAALLGVVTPVQLRKYRRHAAIGVLILAAFITPGPDIFSQLLVAGPLLILYEAGILMAVFAGRKKEVKSEK